MLTNPRFLGGILTFYQAIAKCSRKYAKFKGRAPRSEYWWFALFLFMFQWPLLLTSFNASKFEYFLSFVYFVLVLAFTLPSWAVLARRLHDVGKSGWSWLICLIPIIGIILLIKWLTKEGDPNPNKYGDPDNGPYTPKDIRTSIDMEEELSKEENTEIEETAQI